MKLLETLLLHGELVGVRTVLGHCTETRFVVNKGFLCHTKVTSARLFIVCSQDV